MVNTAARTPPLLYYLGPARLAARDRFEEAAALAADLGFTHLLIAPPFAPGQSGDLLLPADHDRPNPLLAWAAETGQLGEAIQRLARGAAARKLGLLVDLPLSQFALEHALVGANPDCFSVRREAPHGPVDPRSPPSSRGAALARLPSEACRAALERFWRPRLDAMIAAGVAGFRAVRLSVGVAPLWSALVRGSRSRGDLLFLADTTGLPRDEARRVAGAGSDFVLSSLPWWDMRAGWFVEEANALAEHAGLIGMPEAPFGTRLAEKAAAECGPDPLAAQRRALLLAVATGQGLLVPEGFEEGARAPLSSFSGQEPPDRAPAGPEVAAELKALVRQATRLAAGDPLLARRGQLRSLTAPASQATALLRTDTDPRFAARALLILLNPSLACPARVDPVEIRPAMGGAFGSFEALDGSFAPIGTNPVVLRPGEARLGLAGAGKPVRPPVVTGREAALAAASAPRILVGGLDPAVDAGRYAATRTVGERVTVEADALMDGHEVLGVELQWRASDEANWRRARMQPLGNDRFRGELVLERLGRHEYRVAAWHDLYGSFVHGLRKKVDAEVDYALDLREGRLFIEDALTRASGAAAARLEAVLAGLERATGKEAAALLLEPETVAAIDAVDTRPFSAFSHVQPLDAHRTQARFASWYELFPRSITDRPAGHGTLRNVIGAMPRIRAMGFDVLYFPPIHPIGATNRKGRNNSLTPAPDDPGSPYAIGSPAGGHDALHPELGTMEDFRALVAAAQAHGLEIALDFAIQCSPDHPWLKQHPGWFDYRPDGSIKYAENPPKKYEDIVNVDFYKPDAIPDLWIALRDTVLFWVKEGVRTFRVDNPHTKPLPFWEWLIADIRADYPDCIFLAEAFTRPTMMYGLAKIGFSQSYTYFTWRNSKAELTDYMVELTTTAPKDFYRPNFFVNTPDINPYYLQTSGRAGFLVRACLATMLAGLWGMYSGFELLESDALPGREEYKDSEKYEIRVRDWTTPGNIIPDITRLNRIRRAHPALQTHLHVRFLNASNDQILYFAKGLPGQGELILVAVNLDPHHVQEAAIEAPLWEFGLPDHAALRVEDLVRETAFVWRGKMQQVRLDPRELPYLVYSIRPHQGD